MAPFTFSRKALVPIFALLLLLCSSIGRSESLRQIDIADAIDSFATELFAARNDVALYLSGVDAEIGRTIEKIQSLGEFSYASFSARGLVEELYVLAEQSGSGEGKRFLARLYEPLAMRSSAFAVEPSVLEIYNSVQEEERTRPLRFVDPTTRPSGMARPQIPSVVAEAISVISSHAASSSQFSTVIRLAGRTLNWTRPPADVDRVRNTVSASRSVYEALQALVGDHAPPPSVERAMQTLLVELMRDSPAFQADPAAARVLTDLAQQPISRELAELSEVEQTLRSRLAQEMALSGISQTGTPATPTVRLAEILSQSGVEGSRYAADWSDNPGFGNRAAYDSYVSASMAPRDGPRSPIGDRVTPPEGIPSALSSGGGGGGGAPRGYTSARVSARAGRGVSVGGPLEVPSVSPTSAIWMESPVDPSFGRFVILSGQSIYASQWLFTDSFVGAAGTIYGNHGGEGEFVDGQILILFSMDPITPQNDPGYSARASQAEQQVEELLLAAQGRHPLEVAYIVQLMTTSGEADELLRLFELRVNQPIVESLQVQISEIVSAVPRRVVVHPAADGLQLAWAAGRVDFWMANAQQLIGELAALTEASEAWSDSIRRGFYPAYTWQFYERDSVISLSEAPDGQQYGSIEVISRSPLGQPGADGRNHFSVSLFADTNLVGIDGLRESDVPGTWFMEEQSAQADELLDFLFTTHPDFVRVNHYSEALSILRWLEASSVDVSILDALGTVRNVPSPRWISSERELLVTID